MFTRVSLALVAMSLPAAAQVVTPGGGGDLVAARPDLVVYAGTLPEEMGGWNVSQVFDVDPLVGLPTEGVYRLDDEEVPLTDFAYGTEQLLGDNVDELGMTGFEPYIVATVGDDVVAPDGALLARTGEVLPVILRSPSGDGLTLCGFAPPSAILCICDMPEEKVAGASEAEPSVGPTEDSSSVADTKLLVAFTEGHIFVLGSVPTRAVPHGLVIDARLPAAARELRSVAFALVAPGDDGGVIDRGVIPARDPVSRTAPSGGGGFIIATGGGHGGIIPAGGPNPWFTTGARLVGSYLPVGAGDSPEDGLFGATGSGDATWRFFDSEGELVGGYTLNGDDEQVLPIPEGAQTYSVELDPSGPGSTVTSDEMPIEEGNVIHGFGSTSGMAGSFIPGV